MTPFVTAGAGFLLAVLWFDLMFDVQAAPHRDPDLPETVLASIAGYYRRVTAAARPMNRLVAGVMAATLVAIIVQLLWGDAPRWAAAVSLALTAGAISLAAVHTVPSAVRLGSRSGTIAGQSRLARSILRDHLLCIADVAAVLFVQLAFARRWTDRTRFVTLWWQIPGCGEDGMADKSPHHSKDKKKGKTLQEKRAAKRQKRAERRSAEEARNRAEGL